MNVLGQSISKNSLILGLFAILTISVLVFTQTSTAPYIAQARETALKEALHEVLPEDQFNNHITDARITIAATDLLGKEKASEAYVAKQDDVPVAMIVQATAPEGYGGSINLLIGILQGGSVSGVRVVPPHNETPGLGDAIDLQKSDWILGFNGLSLDNLPAPKWKVKKDGGHFDAFTGATITPRAVVNAVYKSLVFFRDQGETLMIRQADRSLNPEGINDTMPEARSAEDVH